MQSLAHTYVVAGLIGVAAGLLGAALYERLPAQPAARPPIGITALEGTSPLPEVTSSEEQLVTATVERTAPAVVSVVITKDVPVIEQFFQDVPGNPFDPFSPFRVRVPQLRQRGTEEREIGGGTGFLVSADGLIVTNRHVVADTDADYTVFTNDEQKYSATVVARDPSNDLAVLRITGSNFAFLTFGDSDRLKVGQTVIAIGNALSEFRNTVSVGVISGLSRSIVAGDPFGQTEQLEEVIQTDAAINRGNSGGPLLNLKGEVVGVNVAVAEGSENIGFALPANTVTTVVKSVQETGTIVRPYLGVRYTQITPELKQRNTLTVDYGALIVRGDTPSDLAVIPGSAADKAGLKEGDIILSVDGVRIEEGHSLATVIRKHQVGDELALTVLSQGQEKTVTATLEAVPQS